jgi:hypothetical protein
MRHFARSSLAIAAATLVAIGCGDRPATKPSETTGQKSGKAEAEAHSHEHGKMLIADAGPYHALLTAHLSPKGNELDIFFETTDDENPTPVAVPLQSFTAYARRAGEDQQHELKFECAPAAERPKGEKPGTCSHFVAKAPWMKPTDTLSVVFTLTLGDRRHRVSWEKFNPKKYAHHEE